MLKIVSFNSNHKLFIREGISLGGQAILSRFRVFDIPTNNFDDMQRAFQ